MALSVGHWRNSIVFPICIHTELLPIQLGAGSSHKLGVPEPERGVIWMFPEVLTPTL